MTKKDLINRRKEIDSLKHVLKLFYKMTFMRIQFMLELYVYRLK